MGLLSVDEYVAGVLAGDRTVLARAITLVESSNDEHRRLAQEVLGRVLADSGGSHRVGITGVPGVGKSTFIDQLGINLTAAGHRVAVWWISSSTVAVRSSGTRPAWNALRSTRTLRPSPHPPVAPSEAWLAPPRDDRALRGGRVRRRGGGDRRGGPVETVRGGDGRHLLRLMLPGAGDELQGIRRGRARAGRAHRGQQGRRRQRRCCQRTQRPTTRWRCT
ncbi:MAG: hypothetical protein R2716_09160 [Microthrixaceae bacterium]